MHMSDALISPAVGGTMWAATAALGAYSIRRLSKNDIFENKNIPVMGVAGAFVFAAQMVNFSIPGTGSSGHLGGGLLLAALLGPQAGFLVLSAVLVIQALFFADGGLLALGCNIFNLGYFTCFIAYPLVVEPITRRFKSKKSLFTACVTGAVCGAVLGSLGVVLETAVSRSAGLSFAAFAAFMLPIHAVIGAVEGVVTAFVLEFLRRAQPSLLETGKPGPGFKASLAGLLLCAVLLAGFISFFASQNPDGLEWSLQNSALTEHTSAVTEAGGGAEPGLAGIVGSATVLVICVGLGAVIKLVKRHKRTVED